MHKFCCAFLALFFLVACHDASQKAATPELPVSDGNLPTRTTVKDNGVLIDYTDTKKGDTTLLFAHGWAINKTYFANQVTFFQDRYRVVTVDLPGFGQSGKNRDSWKVTDFGRDLDSVMEQLDLRNVVLIGHSMSGDIVLSAAVQSPKRVIGVVGIDNFKEVGIPTDPKMIAAFQKAIVQMKTDYTHVINTFFTKQLFSPYTDSSIVHKVLTDASHSDSVTAVRTMEAMNFDEAAALVSWHKPLYLVNADYGATDTSGLKRMNIPFHLSIVPHSGHYPMIERPEEFDKALLETVHLIGTKAKG